MARNLVPFKGKALGTRLDGALDLSVGLTRSPIAERLKVSRFASNL